MKFTQLIRKAVIIIFLASCSLSSSAKLPAKTAEIVEHLQILGYKTRIDTGGGYIVADKQVKLTITELSSVSLQGISIAAFYNLKKGVKKDLKYYQLLSRLNRYDFVKAFETNDGKTLAFIMDSTSGYDRANFTQTIEQFNAVMDAIMTKYNKELLEILD